MHNPRLLTVEDAKNLQSQENIRLFCDHVNPAQYRFLRLLGFHSVVIKHAEGVYYYDQNGNKILDLFGGFGALALGHNHPRILAVRRNFEDEKRHDIALAFISQYVSVLAKNLATLAPDDLDMVFLGTSGSDVVEAALKLAEKAQGSKRNTIVYASSSFHGKSRAALSVTDSTFYRSSFELLPNTICVPFGDPHALEQLFVTNPGIGTLILETVQGGAGIILAPSEYWSAVRTLCNKYNVIWIADEIQCGMGRTGHLFAFEAAGYAPDIITLAKSLGGGKAAIGAMIARKSIYMSAYGKSSTALIHGPSTFAGMGETVCTAIETLHVLFDENLIENSAAVGFNLIGRLKQLQLKYPQLIKEVRGMGLMIGIEFQDLSNSSGFIGKSLLKGFDEKMRGSLSALIGNILLYNHGILVGFTEYNRNVIRIEPPLILTEKETNYFASALDSVLSLGVAGMIVRYVKNQGKYKSPIH